MNKKYIAYGLVFQAGRLRPASPLGGIYHSCHLYGSGTPKAHNDAAAKKGSSERRPLYRGLAGEELLYQGLRQLVMKSVNWDNFFGVVFSPVILVVLILLVVFVNCPGRQL